MFDFGAKRVEEYQILYYLLSRPGSVVTRQALGENVWGKKKVKGNVIDVYIRRLRQKIDQDHQNKLIHTIRGRGYKMSER